MQLFPALPSPLRHMLGLRASVLDRAAIRWARANVAVAHVPHPRVPHVQVSDVFCADGFHPSALGYSQWGAALAAAASDILRGPARR
jgi:lysophospholipase L1-like esterase